MTTQTPTDPSVPVTATASRAPARARLTAEVLGIGAAALAGVALIFVAGFAEASGVHDFAHDQRHSLAFPCH